MLHERRNELIGRQTAERTVFRRNNDVEALGRRADVAVGKGAAVGHREVARQVLAGNITFRTIAQPDFAPPLCFAENGDRTNRNKARLKYVLDAIGFDECCLILATGREATTQEALTRAVTLFADEVAPAFRAPT